MYEPAAPELVYQAAGGVSVAAAVRTNSDTAAALGAAAVVAADVVWVVWIASPAAWIQ